MNVASANPGSQVAGGSESLPSLRRDVLVESNGTNQSGSPTWLIHDPLQRRYFQIDFQTRELLSIWSEGLTISNLVNLAKTRLGLIVRNEQIEQLIEFLHDRNLTDCDISASWTQIERQQEQKKTRSFIQFAHTYLFFKIHLVQPQKILKYLLPIVQPLYSRWVAFGVAITGLAGLYMVSRQWNVFLNTFSDFVSLEGAFFLLIALLFLKLAHELGHALTAVKFGCDVPSMGVAFMMATPILYTDVTDSWRLSSRSQRMMISGAGVFVEIAIACLATFCWVFLPDGTAKSIAFILATSAWIMSLAFNLNPCMKFDGYYLASDFFRIDNLQQRAFAFGRWKLRQLLFAPMLQAPEILNRKMTVGLICYAWVTWIYRLILFTTIALFVYHFCFKLLGIALFILEIWLLILTPIAKEIALWRKIEMEFVSPKRTILALVAGLAITLLAAVPWSTRIQVPAILQVSDLTQVYPISAAKVTRVFVQRGEYVKEASPIIELSVPDIDHKIATTKIQMDIVKLRLDRTIVDNNDRENTLVLTNELGSLNAAYQGLIEQREELIIKAPINGRVLEINPDLHPGMWVNLETRLAILSAQKQHVVRGYLAGSSLYRLDTGATGTFIPEDPTYPSFPVELTAISHSGTPSLQIPELSSMHGGAVAVKLDADSMAVPVNAQYLVTMTPALGKNPPSQIVRGVVNIDGEAVSFLSRTWKHATGILIRETGF